MRLAVFLPFFSVNIALCFIVFLLLGLSGSKGGSSRISAKDTKDATSGKDYLRLNETFFRGGERGQYWAVLNRAGLLAHDRAVGLAINSGLGSIGSGRIGFDVAGGRIESGERGT